MGPSNVVEVPDAVASPEVDRTESQPVEQPASSNGVHTSAQAPIERERSEGSSSDVPNQTLGLSAWLYRSHVASVLWLAVRLWLGYEWFNAGYQKIWGSEKAAFWNGGGAAVKGFATAGVVGSATGKGGASYGWWAAFLHNFVVPNASWIAKLITLSELAIGVLLILGLVTGAAATAGIVLNLVYMFTGSAGVNPAFAIVSLLLILAWRNAGYFGLDRFALPRMARLFHQGPRVDKAAPRTPTVALPVQR